jgi:hypothetical protein
MSGKAIVPTRSTYRRRTVIIGNRPKNPFQGGGESMMSRRCFLVLISVFCVFFARSTDTTMAANHKVISRSFRGDQPTSGSTGDAMSPGLVVNRLDHVGTPDSATARESMIVQHPDGTIFVSGYGDDPAPPQTVPDCGRVLTTVRLGAPSTLEPKPMAPPAIRTSVWPSPRTERFNSPP